MLEVEILFIKNRIFETLKRYFKYLRFWVSFIFDSSISGGCPDFGRSSSESVLFYFSKSSLNNCDTVFLGGFFQVFEFLSKNENIF